MLQFNAFDRAPLSKDGQPIKLPAAATVVLAILGYEPAPIPRAKLARMVWPASGERDARNSLKTALWSLRKWVSIADHDDSIALKTGVDFSPLASAGSENYREFMPSIDLEWAVDLRLKLRRQAADASIKAAQTVAPAKALELAERATQIDPYSEEAAALKVVLLRQTERHREAAAAERAHRTRMFRDLGSLPKPEPIAETEAHPLATACQWLLDRTPEQAADLLLCSQRQWTTMSAAAALRLHDQVESHPRLSASVRLRLRAQRMLIKWGLDGLSRDLPEAMLLWEQAIAEGESAAAASVGAAIAYAHLSHGDVVAALAQSAKADQFAEQRVTDPILRHRTRLVHNIVNLQGRRRPFEPRFLRTFIDDFSESSPQEKAEVDQTLASIYVQANDLVRADEHLQAAKAYHQASHSTRTLAWLAIDEADLYDHAGDPAASYAILTELIARPARDLGQSAYCMALDRAASAATKLQEFSEAAGHFHRSNRIRKSLGTRRSSLEREAVLPFRQIVAGRLGAEWEASARRTERTVGNPAGLFA